MDAVCESDQQFAHAPDLGGRPDRERGALREHGVQVERAPAQHSAGRLAVADDRHIVDVDARTILSAVALRGGRPASSMFTVVGDTPASRARSWVLHFKMPRAARQAAPVSWVIGQLLAAYGRSRLMASIQAAHQCTVADSSMLYRAWCPADVRTSVSSFSTTHETVLKAAIQRSCPASSSVSPRATASRTLTASVIPLSARTAGRVL